MKHYWVRILLVAAGLFVFLVVVLIWAAISRLSSGYEVDGDQVYFRTFDNVNWRVDLRPIAGADPNTIRTVSGSGGTYGSDGNSVYFQETVISDADPGSFRVLDWRQELSRDASRVFWKSIRLSNDPDNFQSLGRGYSKDSKHVYFASRIVEGADPETFVVTGTSTSKAKDKDHEYDMGRRQ